jgi:peptidyl-prolyl cis-trans isomerase SurA
MQFRLIFLLMTLLFSITTFANEKLLDKVIAIVNAQVITQSELDQQMKMAVAQIQSAGLPMPPADKLRQQVLNQLIDIDLQKTVAKKANIFISDAQVEAAIAKIAADNHMSTVQLQKSIAAEGMSYSAYRHQIHDQMLIAQVQQAMVAPKVKVTPPDVLDAKNAPAAHKPIVRTNPHNTRYHVVDILVIKPGKADELLSKIRESNNPGSILNKNPAVKINDLGFRQLSQLPDIFIKPVQSLNPGQFSDLVKAPNGTHILSLIAVEGGQQATHAAASALTPEQRAYQKKFEEALQKWLETLRGQSYIKIIS